MSRVFISFINEDADLAAAVQEFLAKTLGLAGDVFVTADRTQVYAGDEWLAKIRSALGEASVIVSMLSERSIRRPWINFEAGAAWLDRSKVVIPCCYGGLTKDGLPHPYSSIQAVDLPEGADYLARSVHHHLKLDSLLPMRRFRFLSMLPTESAAQLRSSQEPYERLEAAFESNYEGLKFSESVRADYESDDASTPEPGHRG